MHVDEWVRIPWQILKQQMRNEMENVNLHTLNVNPTDITFRSWNTIIAENIIICNVAET